MITATDDAEAEVATAVVEVVVVESNVEASGGRVELIEVETAIVVAVVDDATVGCSGRPYDPVLAWYCGMYGTGPGGWMDEGKPGRFAGKYSGWYIVLYPPVPCTASPSTALVLSTGIQKNISILHTKERFFKSPSMTKNFY